MRVELIHPPHVNSTDDRLDPPLGLLMIASHLGANGINVGITDLSGMVVPTETGLEGYRKQVADIPYADIYGITVYITSMKVTEDIIRLCRLKNPKCKIVVGGAHPSVRPYDFTIADHVVIGNGEEAMVRIAKDEIPITTRFVVGKSPENYFLFPAYHLIEPLSYHRKIDGKTSLPYLTSRGCPFSCNFCGLSNMHKLGKGVVHFAEPELVYEQIKRMKEEIGIDRIAFQDDIFTMKLDRLKKILDLIKPLNIRFRCMGRAGMDTEETYKILAEAGCDQVSWGIESGSQYILDRMNKKVTVQDNKNVIQWAKKYGITSRAFFIIGYPGETKETLEETKRFIIDADPDQYFASNFVPYPGTKCGDYPLGFGIKNVTKDLNQFYQVSKYGTGGMTIDTEWLTKEQFRELEIEFRTWLNKREFRGNKQDYEVKLHE
jgi:radical SAM superfamily enzyme YgiQ (UPF0313 family)